MSSSSSSSSESSSSSSSSDDESRDSGNAVVLVHGHVYIVLSTEKRVTVGRAAMSDMCVDDSSVSSTHCVFTGLYVTDNNSTNGLFINGERVSTGVKTAVKVGDEIQVGSQTLRVELQSTVQESKTVIVPHDRRMTIPLNNEDAVPVLRGRKGGGEDSRKATPRMDAKTTVVSTKTGDSKTSTTESGGKPPVPAKRKPEKMSRKKKTELRKKKIMNEGLKFGLEMGDVQEYIGRLTVLEEQVQGLHYQLLYDAGSSEDEGSALPSARSRSASRRSSRRSSINRNTATVSIACQTDPVASDDGNSDGSTTIEALQETLREREDTHASAVAQLEQQLAELQRDLFVAQSERTESQEEALQLNDINSGHVGEIHSLKEEVELLKQELAEEGENARSRAQELDEWRGKEEVWGNERDMLQQEVEYWKRQAAQKTEALEQQGMEIRAQMSEEIQSLHDEKTALWNKQMAFQQELEEQEVRSNQTLLAKVNDKQRELDDMQKRLVGIRSEVDAEREEMQKERELLLAKVSSAEYMVEEQRLRAEELEKTISETAEQRERTAWEIKSLKREVAIAQAKLQGKHSASGGGPVYAALQINTHAAQQPHSRELAGLLENSVPREKFQMAKASLDQALADNRRMREQLALALSQTGSTNGNAISSSASSASKGGNTNHNSASVLPAVTAVPSVRLSGLGTPLLSPNQILHRNGSAKSGNNNPATAPSSSSSSRGMASEMSSDAQSGRNSAPRRPSHGDVKSVSSAYGARSTGSAITVKTRRSGNKWVPGGPHVRDRGEFAGGGVSRAVSNYYHENNAASHSGITPSLASQLRKRGR